MENYKILIVDDDPKFHQKIRMSSIFRRRYEFDGAMEEKTAFEKIKTNKYDLILLDLDLAYGGNYRKGIENIPKIQQLVSSTPIIVVTSDGKVTTVADAMKAGATYFLYKKEYDSSFWNEQFLKYIGFSKTAGTVKNIKATVEDKGSSLTKDEGFISNSSVIADIKKKLRKISELPDTNLLIVGETGTGKEVSANYFHKHSPRKDKPFVPVNLAAIPETLLESSLFGHKKGAFTGATEDLIGFAEQANGGILFLDEIGDIPMDFQVKLLRFLENKVIRPLGAKKDLQLDIQIVSATNRHFDRLIEENKFRKDLYERLKGYTIELPPLKDRKEDIEPLIEHFIGSNIQEALTDTALEQLKLYSWGGNVRELRSAVKTMQIHKHLYELDKITFDCLPKEIKEYGVSELKQFYGDLSGIDYDKKIALKELEEVERALSTHKKKGEAAVSIGKTGDTLRHLVLSRYEKYSELFVQFPLIKKSYKLSSK